MRTLRTLGTLIAVLCCFLLSCKEDLPQLPEPPELPELPELPKPTIVVPDTFIDHGVTANAANARGIVATTGEKNSNVFLVWLFDHTGGYALLHVNTVTGNSTQIPTPHETGGDCPYSSLLSKKNRYYTLFNSHFSEFDPVTEKFTSCIKTTPKMAMSMTEDSLGRIWAATYPNSGLICFDPESRKIVDYGSVYKQNWAQYPRYIAVGTDGYVYIGIGESYDQIIAYNPSTRMATPLIQEGERANGIAYVYKDKDGNVYGRPVSVKEDLFYELKNGSINSGLIAKTPDPENIITGTQALFHKSFPNGDQLISVNLLTGIYSIRTNGSTAQKNFSYRSEGPWTLGAITAPGNLIFGGTSFPMRYFVYDTKNFIMSDASAVGQLNALLRVGDKVYAGSYPTGSLLEYSFTQTPVVGTRNITVINLASLSTDIHRPHRLFYHANSEHVIMGGTPDYGLTGGGLYLWDTQNKTGVLLKHTELIPNQSTMSMADFEGNLILGGTTITPGTGGITIAKEAELYLLDVVSRKIEWRSVAIQGATEYTDLCNGKDGIVYGFVNKSTFFAFDSKTKTIIKTQNTNSSFGNTTGNQSPCVFVKDDEGNIYVLFQKKIGKIDQDKHVVTSFLTSPVSIEAGGAYLNNSIYFISGSHLYSYRFPLYIQQN